MIETLTIVWDASFRKVFWCSGIPQQIIAKPLYSFFWPIIIHIFDKTSWLLKSWEISTNSNACEFTTTGKAMLLWVRWQVFYTEYTLDVMGDPEWKVLQIHLKFFFRLLIDFVKNCTRRSKCSSTNLCKQFLLAFHLCDLSLEGWITKKPHSSQWSASAIVFSWSDDMKVFAHFLLTRLYCIGHPIWQEGVHIDPNTTKMLRLNKVFIQCLRCWHTFDYLLSYSWIFQTSRVSLFVTNLSCTCT